MNEPWTSGISVARVPDATFIWLSAAFGPSA
jgi:hypothetical protein